MPKRRTISRKQNENKKSQTVGGISTQTLTDLKNDFSKLSQSTNSSISDKDVLQSKKELTDAQNELISILEDEIKTLKQENESYKKQISEIDKRNIELNKQIQQITQDKESTMERLYDDIKTLLNTTKILQENLSAAQQINENYKKKIQILDQKQQYTKKTDNIVNRSQAHDHKEEEIKSIQQNSQDNNEFNKKDLKNAPNKAISSLQPDVEKNVSVADKQKEQVQTINEPKQENEIHEVQVKQKYQESSENIKDKDNDHADINKEDENENSQSWPPPRPKSMREQFLDYMNAAERLGVISTDYSDSKAFIENIFAEISANPMSEINKNKEEILNKILKEYKEQIDSYNNKPNNHKSITELESIQGKLFFISKLYEKKLMDKKVLV